MRKKSSVSDIAAARDALGSGRLSTLCRIPDAILHQFIVSRIRARDTHGHAAAATLQSASR
jgi:hypothetical protein